MEKQATNHIPLQGQPNFRDLGGFKTANGRIVKPGLIYRSGDFSRLTDEDLDTLQELDIKTVVDFRSGTEIKMFGEDRLPTGAKLLELHIEPGNWGPAFFEAAMEGDSSRIPENLLADTNRSIIRDATGQMSGLFEALSDPSNLPLVFHCTHGKDRTGIAAAVVLMALGVPAAITKADYLKSNDYRRDENEEQLAQLRQMIAASRGIEPLEVDMAKFNQLFYQESSYFEAALDEVEKQYGSFENYLEEGLGIDQSQILELRERFTKKARS